MTAEEDRTPLSSDVPPSAGSTQPSAWSEVWARIKEHKVAQWTLAYVAFAYTALHAVQMAREAFEWPTAVSRVTFLVLLLGTPIAVTLAWYHGHRARQRISATELSILTVLLLIAGSLLWFYAASRRVPERVPATSTAAVPVPSAAFAPPPHSVAVLPFVNMSGDKEQEYFSDGLTEELLNSLARINELQVAARTSAFSFKGKDTDIGTIARKLNVGAILEGSVRRSGHTIRITAQLNNAVTGFHLWSQTYDRNLRDILKLQTEIATAVASALKITLLGDIAAKIEVGGTRNPAALDAYMRASNTWSKSESEKDYQAAIAGYTQAIHFDRDYAIAYADRSVALSNFAWDWAKGRDVREYLSRSEADALKAIALAPNLAEGHMALAAVLEQSLDFTRANQEYKEALALAPENATLLRKYGVFAVDMGYAEAGITAARRAVTLDPLNSWARHSLGTSLTQARRYDEAIVVLTDAHALDPNVWTKVWLGLAYYGAGDFQSARAKCASAEIYLAQFCLAITYNKLGRHADAETARAAWAASAGQSSKGYAEIYAQWGDSERALDWLERAMHLREQYLEDVKASWLLDPLRKEPRFQAIERALKFPN